ncbi:10219_t:CDS:1, partial [Paraglomus brasilianum]
YKRDISQADEQESELMDINSSPVQALVYFVGVGTRNRPFE